MFHLVVTGVGYKNFEGPSIKCIIENLNQREIINDLKLLFKEWKKTLRQHMDSLSFLPEASSVYRGPMWKASMESFNKINGPYNLWIISSGFGFINYKDKISGYHATFKSRYHDSIYRQEYFFNNKKSEVNKKWWNLFVSNRLLKTSGPKSIHELVNNSHSDDVVLIAAGFDYYEAIYDDLNKIDVSEDSPKLAIVGIQKLDGEYKPSVPRKLEQFIQPYKNGKKLREFLGGGSIQVHPKSALFLIEQYNQTGKFDYRFP